MINPVFNSDEREKLLSENIYIKHYKSGYAVFKNNPIFGVGNKNYYLEIKNKINKEKKYLPDTHPHQIYLNYFLNMG